MNFAAGSENQLISNTYALPISTALAFTLGYASTNAVSDVNLSSAQACPDAHIQSNNKNDITGAASWQSFERLRILYDVEKPEHVFLFLNDQIAKLLIDAEPVIREHFIACKLSMQMKTDPDNDGTLLVVSIHTSQPWAESERQLENFDRNWWLAKAWIPSSKKISIDYISA